jgi:hypothetical protein
MIRGIAQDRLPVRRRLNNLPDMVKILVQPYYYADGRANPAAA